MAPQREDNEIVTQLRIINKQIDQMTNKFGDRLARLERQHFNDHGMVKLRPKLGEFNVIRVVMRVNTNMDEFVANNMNMSDVDFKDMSMGQGGSFGQQQNFQFFGERNGDNFGQRDNYRYRDHNAN